MSNYLLIGNWKMNLGVSQAQKFLGTILPHTRNLKKSSVWVTPPLVSTAAVAQLLKGTAVGLGSQNVHWAESGAFTGEVSPGMLKELGCSFALVGHSERRHVFGESSEISATRAIGAASAGLKAVFCVGEKLEERERGATLAVVKEQLTPLKGALTPAISENFILAYEPVWAIGTGKVATPAEIEETCRGIVALWKELFGTECPTLLYGGSVDPTNVSSILKCPSVKGCLIGGASIHEEKFPGIIKAAEAL